MYSNFLSQETLTASERKKGRKAAKSGLKEKLGIFRYRKFRYRKFSV